MDKRFDLTRLLKAVNYSGCYIEVTPNEGEKFEVIQEDDMYDMLSEPDVEAVDLIYKEYKSITWRFIDNCMLSFKIDCDVEDDSIHFWYNDFNLKTKYTLINILKSQIEWGRIGICMYDNHTEEIIDDAYYDEDDTASDIWLYCFEDFCDKYVVNSHAASLFKGQEKDDEGEVIEILDLVLDTDTPE